MKWNKFTLKTKTDVEDIIISTLADIGIQGAEIEDKQPLTEEDKKQMFVDILPDMPEDDGVAYLNFYLDEDENVEEMLWISVRVPSPHPRQRTRTGSTTGNSISNSFTWMIF